MSACVLPNEIFYHIFSNLRGGDVLECRRVCRRWEAAVDALGDGFWRRMCAKEHIGEVYEDAYRKARLSWRELYTSLSLWSDVAAADVEVLSIPEKHVNNYQVLTGGVIAVSCRRRRLFTRIRKETSCSDCDTIVYYDPETVTELRRECFDFMFQKFEENEHFYIMKVKGHNRYENNNYVHVILKSNKKCLDFGRNARSTWTWVLRENMVYLQCFQVRDHFYRIRAVEQNNDCTLETEHIQYQECYFRIRAVSNINHEQTNILASGGSVNKISKIYSLIHKKITLLCYINTRDDTIYPTIKNHGFSLRCLPIFELLTRFSFTNEPDRALYHYAKTVIIHKHETHTKSIDIYYIPKDNPYEVNGKLNLTNALPTKSIDLGVLSSDLDNQDLNQIDVLETINGHKVIISFRGRTFVVGLSHNKPSERRIVNEDSDDFYSTVYNTQNKFIYTTYHTATCIYLTGN